MRRAGQCPKDTAGRVRGCLTSGLRLRPVAQGAWPGGVRGWGHWAFGQPGPPAFPLLGPPIQPVVLLHALLRFWTWSGPEQLQPTSQRPGGGLCIKHTDLEWKFVFTLVLALKSQCIFWHRKQTSPPRVNRLLSPRSDEPDGGSGPRSTVKQRVCRDHSPFSMGSDLERTHKTVNTHVEKHSTSRATLGMQNISCTDHHNG